MEPNKTRLILPDIESKNFNVPRYQRIIKKTRYTNNPMEIHRLYQPVMENRVPRQEYLSDPISHGSEFITFS